MTLDQVNKELAEGWRVREVVRVKGGLRFNVQRRKRIRTLRVNAEELGSARAAY